MAKIGRPPTDPELKRRFARNLKRIRRERRITQKMIAEKLGLAIMSVSDWEREVSLPTEENLIALAEFLDTTRKELLK